MKNESLYQRIEKQPYKVFSCSDFLGNEGSNYKSICKSLERLTKEGKIKRVAKGLYGKPSFNETLKIEEPFPLEDIVAAISRKYGWRVAPTGSLALNSLGLSQQVPYRLSFVSTGPYKKYVIENCVIVFKHSFGKEIVECSANSNMVFQAFKALGPKKIDKPLVLKMLSSLNEEDRKALMAESRYFPEWIRKRLLDATK